jgi:DNA-binding SARP family transcriptional activator
MSPAESGKRLITLFGGAGIHVDGAPIRGRASHRHPLAIAAYLVVNGGRGVTRDKLIALLWPERDADAGRNLLKVNVHELRKELGDGAIRSIGDQLSADLSAISCDAADFLAAIANGDDSVAVTLYAGPFLDGFFIKEAPEFEQWVDAERARLAAMYGASLDRLAAAAEARGDLEGALKWRRMHASHDPYHADVATRLVHTLAASGDRAGAVQFAESFVERRQRDLDISDDHQIILLARQLKGVYTPATPVFGVSAAAAALPANAEPAPVIAPPKSATRRIWIGVAAVAIVGAIFIASKRIARAPVIASGAAPRVAIVPFRVIGADTSMRDGLGELLAARFTGDGAAQSVDPQRVASAWRDASKAGTPSLEQALVVARSVGATELLAGDIATASDSTAVAMRLYDANTGKLIASARSDASRATSLAGIADRLTVEILARAAGEPDDRISSLARRPVRAARKYIAAQVAYRSARYAVAESLFAQALDADSTFGAAGLGLAMANSWTVINDHYGQGRDAAMHHLAAMSDRDREFANAFFGTDPALGPVQPAPVYLKRWEDLVEKYPDWTEAWYQLGDRYYHYGGLSGLPDASDRARSAFRRALSLDSSFAAPLHHLIEIDAARGERVELRDVGARYFAGNPTVNRDGSAIGWEMAMGLGDSAWVKRIRANFEMMPREELTRIAWVTDVNGWPRGDAERAVALVDRKAGTASEHEHAAILRFALSLNHGDAQEARVAAATLGAQFPDRPVGALWDLFAAMFETNDAALAADAVKRLDEFVRSPVSGDHVRRDQHHLSVCMTGYYRATRGELPAARAAYDRVSGDLRTEDNNFAKRNASVCEAMLSATIEAANRGPRAYAAVARLDTILLRERVPPHVILETGTLVAARLHAALGDTAAALVAARRREHLTGEPLFLAAERRLEALLLRAEPDARREGSP